MIFFCVNGNLVDVTQDYGFLFIYFSFHLF